MEPAAHGASPSHHRPRRPNRPHGVRRDPWVERTHAGLSVRDDLETEARRLVPAAPFSVPGGGYNDAVRPDKEQPGDVVREVESGQSERTPFLALTGVTLAVAALVGVVLVIVVAVYLVA